MMQGPAAQGQGRRVPILMYHQIGRIPPKHQADGTRTRYRSLIVRPSAFARQMWLLKTLGYRGVCMSEVMQYLRGEKTEASHGRVVGITFDDGYQNNFFHALPVLLRFGFRSTVYVVSVMVGGHNEWDIGKGVAKEPLMTKAQLQAWVAAGQEVGSHTRHHVDLHAVDAQSAEDEIAHSKTELQALIDQPCLHFCYPYGRYSALHLPMLTQAGYVSATTVMGGVASAHHSALELPRIGVMKNTTLFGLWRTLLTSQGGGATSCCRS